MEHITIANIRKVIGKESFKHQPGDNLEYCWTRLFMDQVQAKQAELVKLGFKTVRRVPGFGCGQDITLQFKDDWAAFLYHNDGLAVVVDLHIKD